MKIDAFLQQNSARIAAYVATTRRRFRLPADLEADLFQACVIAAMGALPYWKSALPANADTTPRLSKSAFNWCAGPMRREMQRTIRSHYGYKPNSKEPIEAICNAYSDDLGIGCEPDQRAVQAQTEDIVEMRRLLEATPRTPHLLRFLAVSLSPAGGADLARAQGVSRQAVCTSVGRVRRDLKAALG